MPSSSALNHSPSRSSQGYSPLRDHARPQGAQRPEDEAESPASGSRSRQRAPAACLQCRRLKSRCKRGPDPSQPCERCKMYDLACEMVKSRRGRVAGSRNKRTLGLHNSIESVQAALDRIREDAGLSNERRRRKRPRASPLIDGEGEGESQPEEPAERVGGERSSPFGDSSGPRHDSPVAYPELEDPTCAVTDLPLESTLPSPEPNYGDDHGHPLALLSNVGSTFERNQHFDASSGGNDNTVLGGHEPVSIAPGWTRQQLKQATAKRSRYFARRPGTAKRDVAPVLDPISRNLVSVEQAEHLVGDFFAILQPQIGFMDPSIHTLVNMRTRSALLVTAVLATSAQTQEAAPLRRLAKGLYRHSEALLVTVVSRNAKSPEIVLALLILSLWPRCPERIVDDRSRTLLALALNMALELGMNRQVSCRADADETAQRWHRDRTRTWIACVIQDKSQSAFSGKLSMLHSVPDVSNMNQWLKHPLHTPGDWMLVSFLELRTIEFDMRERLGSEARPYMVEATRVGADAALDGWVQMWCTEHLVHRARFTATMMRVLGHHVQLLITTASRAPQQNIIASARASLEFVLAGFGTYARYICRTVCGMITWAAALLLRLDYDSSAGLVHDVALAMAPFGDGRFEDTYAHLYGSLLLSLSLNRSGTSPFSPTNLAAPSTAALPLMEQASLVPSDMDGSNANATSLQSAPPIGPIPGGRDVHDYYPLDASGSGPGPATNISEPLSADQLSLLLGLDPNVGADLELPWDLPQLNVASDGVAVSPPLEWLFSDLPTGNGGGTRDDDGSMIALWGFGLGWPNAQNSSR